MGMIVAKDLRSPRPCRAVRFDERAGVDLEKPLRLPMDIGALADLLDPPIDAEQQTARFERIGLLRLAKEPLDERACDFDGHLPSC